MTPPQQRIHDHLVGWALAHLLAMAEQGWPSDAAIQATRDATRAAADTAIDVAAAEFTTHLRTVAG